MAQALQDILLFLKLLKYWIKNRSIIDPQGWICDIKTMNQWTDKNTVENKILLRHLPPQASENTDQKKFCIWTLFMQCVINSAPKTEKWNEQSLTVEIEIRFFNKTMLKRQF